LTRARLLGVVIVLVAVALLSSVAYAQNVTESVSAWGTVEIPGYTSISESVYAWGKVQIPGYVSRHMEVKTAGVVESYWLNTTLRLVKYWSDLLVRGTLYVLPAPTCADLYVEVWTWFSEDVKVTVEDYVAGETEYLPVYRVAARTSRVLEAPAVLHRMADPEHMILKIRLCGRWFYENASLLTVTVVDANRSTVSFSLPIRYVGFAVMREVSIPEVVLAGKKFRVRARILYKIPGLVKPVCREPVTIYVENATTGELILEKTTYTDCRGYAELTLVLNKTGTYRVVVTSLHSVNTSAAYVTVLAAPPPRPLALPVAPLVGAAIGFCVLGCAVYLAVKRLRARRTVARTPVFTALNLRDAALSLRP